MPLDLDRYCERVKLSGIPRANEDGLFAIHRAQAYAIPFEGFDPLLGRGVRLDLPSLEKKLVRSRRGGFCFELNGLMLAVLNAAGFQTEPLLARVFFQRPDTAIRARTHQVTLVTVPGREYLVDVGFGMGTPRSPIPFVLGEHEIEGEHFRLVPHELGTMVQHRFPAGWEDLYVFTRERAHPADFEVSSYYMATHPLSRFRTEPRARRMFEGGGVTVGRSHVTWTRDGEVTSIPTPRGEELLTLLDRELGIELDEIPTWQSPVSP